MILLDKLEGWRIILASKSPRRRELMSGCGFHYELADGYDVEEIYPDDLPAHKVPLYLANLKSDAYPGQLAEKDILVTADTVVILEGCILGKPDGREDAIEMLRRISGKEHVVISGVVLRTGKRRMAFSVGSRVVFRQLRDEEIEYYVDKYEPYDKAGAYGIQEWIGYTGIKGVKGSFYNVMGLPIQSLYVNLEKLVSGK